MYYKLALSAALLLMSGNVWAEVVTGSPESGNGCGAKCSWSFDTETGILDITGSGDMDDWNIHNNNIGTDSWKAQPWYDYREQITDINIGENITSIGDFAFARTSIKTLDIPSSVRKIGIDGFQWSSIERIDIPETVISMGQGLFSGATKLTHVTLPSNTEAISNWFFGSTYSLKELILPENVKIIGNDSLTITALERLVVPASVETISRGAFRGTECEENQCREYYAKNLKQMYCTSAQMEQCEAALVRNESTFKPTHYEKSGNDYLVYDDKGNVTGKYADMTALSQGKATETYKYDSAGHLTSIFDGNGQRTWGKKIYTVEEAMESTAHGDRFHVSLTYK